MSGWEIVGLVGTLLETPGLDGVLPLTADVDEQRFTDAGRWLKLVKAALVVAPGVAVVVRLMTSASCGCRPVLLLPVVLLLLFRPDDVAVTLRPRRPSWRSKFSLTAFNFLIGSTVEYLAGVGNFGFFFGLYL